jgi:hypothetical protein
VRPPEWSETGRADSAFIAHSPTCGERRQKLHYGSDRRRVLLDQMKRASHLCFVSQACRKRTLRPSSASRSIFIMRKTYLCYHADAYY